ncbi:MAG TPA: hypothetical protein VJI46_02830 [Candidatus Nanoarchaeia archaeon]|nr:hypothetical protein [Candidatus Nanoarchaeia archaeon]
MRKGFVIIGLIILALFLAGCNAGYYQVKFSCNTTSQNFTISEETCTTTSSLNDAANYNCSQSRGSVDVLVFQNGCFVK